PLELEVAHLLLEDLAHPVALLGRAGLALVLDPDDSRQVRRQRGDVGRALGAPLAGGPERVCQLADRRRQLRAPGVPDRLPARPGGPRDRLLVDLEQGLRVRLEVEVLPGERGPALPQPRAEGGVPEYPLAAVGDVLRGTARQEHGLDPVLHLEAMLVGGRTTGRPEARNSGSLDGSL